MTRDWQRGMGERSSSFGLTRPPPATRWLLIANGIAFLFSVLLYFSASGFYLEQFLPAFALAPERWAAWFPFVPFWQLATYAFLHDVGSLGHVLFNMLTLYFFGTMLEGIVGTRRFAFAYAGAGLAGALLYLACVAAGALPLPALGASGAVLGVMVACATLRSRSTSSARRTRSRMVGAVASRTRSTSAESPTVSPACGWAGSASIPSLGGKRARARRRANDARPTRNASIACSSASGARASNR
jgi:membrane associated rhomboid family serine protease